MPTLRVNLGHADPRSRRTGQWSPQHPLAKARLDAPQVYEKCGLGPEKLKQTVISRADRRQGDPPVEGSERAFVFLGKPKQIAVCDLSAAGDAGPVEYAVVGE